MKINRSLEHSCHNQDFVTSKCVSVNLEFIRFGSTIGRIELLEWNF